MSKKASSKTSGTKVVTQGFGVPVKAGEYFPHYFIVNIPRGSRGAVLITEDLGEVDDTNIKRVKIPRANWTQIAGAVQREFNERLVENKVDRGKWKVGDNPVYNLLGKELCVLGWAIEEADKEHVEIALRNWLALRPEERWWLFGMVAMTSGSIEQKPSSWRKALKFALSDVSYHQKTIVGRGRPRKKGTDLFQPDLF